MNDELNPKFINMVCLMFKLTDKQLDLLEGPFMFIARPVLVIVALVVVTYWLLTDIAWPKLIAVVTK